MCYHKYSLHITIVVEIILVVEDWSKHVWISSVLYIFVSLRARNFTTFSTRESSILLIKRKKNVKIKVLDIKVNLNKKFKNKDFINTYLDKDTLMHYY